MKTPEIRTRQPGEFCWINMLTPHPAEAREFFGKLLGWTYFEMPGIGHGIRVGGRDVGGLFDLHGPNCPAGSPAAIGVMVKVDSAEATGAKVAELGGKSLPVMDIFDAGRMAVCFDPNGAAFDVWEPKAMSGTDVDGSLHGAPCWFETITTDVAKAKAFYTSLFGWTTSERPIGDWHYTTFSLGSTQVAGMMPVLPNMGECPPHWATYFTVTDINESTRLAVELGGTIGMPVCEIVGIGQMAGISSPQGIWFYIIQHQPK